MRAVHARLAQAAQPASSSGCSIRSGCHGVKQGDLLGFLSYDLPIK
jgi:hypothetical protein